MINQCYELTKIQFKIPFFGPTLTTIATIWSSMHQLPAYCRCTSPPQLCQSRQGSWGISYVFTRTAFKSIIFTIYFLNFLIINVLHSIAFDLSFDNFTILMSIFHIVKFSWFLDKTENLRTTLPCLLSGQ